MFSLYSLGVGLLSVLHYCFIVLLVFSLGEGIICRMALLFMLVFWSLFLAAFSVCIFLMYLTMLI